MHTYYVGEAKSETDNAVVCLQPYEVWSETNVPGEITLTLYPTVQAREFAQEQ